MVSETKSKKTVIQIQDNSPRYAKRQTLEQKLIMYRARCTNLLRTASKKIVIVKTDIEA